MIYKKGVKRPLVGYIQHAAGVSVDYWFGTQTEEAVKAYQRKHSLTVDGKVGPATLNCMFDSVEKYDPIDQIAEVVATFEGGSVRDAFGYTSTIDDGAGTNYGFMQHNKYGSL